jgi:hypothetical protein
MSEAIPMALPPQYEQKPLKIYALQYTGTNNAEMLSFASSYLYETPEGVLMQQRNPFPIATGEWVVQWSNTDKRGQFDRVSESNFGLTWTLKV